MFNPSEIKAQTGRVFLVTGGTSGLGAGFISEIAKHNPAHIYFTGRNANRADGVIKKVADLGAKATFIECDHASLNIIKAAAAKFLSMETRLDVLVLNAGIMAVEAGTTKDGYEIQFGVNHLSHALLVQELLPVLEKTAAEPNADVRVISLSSTAHKQAPSDGIKFETLKSEQRSLGGMIPGGRWSRYGQSKLANLLYPQELASHHPSITSVSVHPGVIFTDLWHNLPMTVQLPARMSLLGQGIPVEEGPYSALWAATTERANLKSGEYYVPGGKVGPRLNKSAANKELSGKLWDWTAKELASYRNTSRAVA